MLGVAQVQATPLLKSLARLSLALTPPATIEKRHRESIKPHIGHLTQRNHPRKQPAALPNI